MPDLVLPHYLEWVSAGFPSAAEGYEDEPLNLHELLVKNPAATFFYRVAGDHLRAEFIRDGSILVVDRSVRPKRGRLALVEHDGEFIVVRFPPDWEPVEVCGVVVAVVTRF